MQNWTVARIGAVAGIGFIALTLIGDLAAGTLIAFIALLVWVLVTSFLLWRAVAQPEAAAVPRAGPA